MIENFFPKMYVAGCMVENMGKILLLQRHKDKPQGLTWGIPSGKIAKNETILSGIQRELFEETNLFFKKEDLKKITSFLIRYPKYDFIYDLFFTKYNLCSPKSLDIILKENEICDYQWIGPEKAILKLQNILIPGGNEVLQTYINYKKNIYIPEKIYLNLK